jgi:hypothetical protein
MPAGGPLLPVHHGAGKPVRRKNRKGSLIRYSGSLALKLTGSSDPEASCRLVAGPAQHAGNTCNAVGWPPTQSHAGMPRPRLGILVAITFSVGYAIFGLHVLGGSSKARVEVAHGPVREDLNLGKHGRKVRRGAPCLCPHASSTRKARTSSLSRRCQLGSRACPTLAPARCSAGSRRGRRAAHRHAGTLGGRPGGRARASGRPPYTGSRVSTRGAPLRLPACHA